MSRLDPGLFAEGPARDSRFVVAETWEEAVNLPPDDPRALTEFLHRQMNEEVNGLEIAARALTDFPDADWALRMAIARQCWDETRHVEMFRRSCESRGGQVGAFPVLNFQYRIVTRIDSLIGRLAVQNRSFEATGIDAIESELAAMRLGHDPDLVALFDAQVADEIQHVRYANVWVKKLAETGGAQATFDMLRAVAQAQRAFETVAGAAAVTYEVAEAVRREAGFTEDEIEAARRRAARR